MSDHDPQKRYDDPKAFPTFAILIIGSVLVLVIVIALQVLYYRAQNAEDRRKIVAQAPEGLLLLRSQQQEQLAGYRWVSEQDGVAAIPIERAMEIAARELNAARAAATREVHP